VARKALRTSATTRVVNLESAQMQLMSEKTELENSHHQQMDRLTTHVANTKARETLLGKNWLFFMVWKMKIKAIIATRNANTAAPSLQDRSDSRVAAVESCVNAMQVELDVKCALVASHWRDIVHAANLRIRSERKASLSTLIRRLCLKWRHRTQTVATQHNSGLALDRQQNGLIKAHHRDLLRTIDVGLRSRHKASILAAVTAMCIKWRTRAQ